MRIITKLDFIFVNLKSKNHQWNAAQQQNQQAKTGGQNWKPGASTTPTMPMAGAWPTVKKKLSSLS